MHTSRLIFTSLWILACFATETVSDTTYDESNNFNGLILALKDLDYGSVLSFPSPSLSFLSPPVSSSSKGCTLTVSIIKEFRNPPHMVVC